MMDLEAAYPIGSRVYLRSIPEEGFFDLVGPATVVGHDEGYVVLSVDELPEGAIEDVVYATVEELTQLPY